jgi:hypothetical protein
VLQGPARLRATVAQENRQPASDDLDIPQNPLSKFDLGLELANIARCSRRYRATANCILKATKRGINKIHRAPTQRTFTQENRTATIRRLQLLIKPPLSNAF